MPTNKTLVFKQVPHGMPKPGQDLVIEDRGPFDPCAAPPQGGVTLSILYASFDPYMRGRMRPKEIKSYSAAFDLNGPVTNSCVARVLASDHKDYAAGDLVFAFLPIAEYATLSAAQVPLIRYKINNKHGLKDLALFLGPLGMPGLTAYSSLHEIGQPKKGETIFVSSAAGAVGQLVGIIAKREGLRVIGSVGSDDKLEFITKDLGYDAGFNYKKEKPLDALKRLAPEGVDIYYENVGGEHLEAALQVMNNYGRIVGCGMISEYNTPYEQQKGVKGLMNIVMKRLTFRGFIVGDEEMGPKYAKEHQEKVAQWLADGSFKAKLHVDEGIDRAAEALIGIFEGKNFGKAVLKIKDE